MKHPDRFIVVLTAVCLVAASWSAPAFAQGSATSSISGVVTDVDGGVIPGASVRVRNTATGVTFSVITNTSGAFAVPVLDPGTYSVTVALSGFKTAVFDNLRLVAATPMELRPKLEVGSLTETVTVVGGAQLVQTQSATVATTISVDQINSLPLPTRNAMNFITTLAGVDTATVTRSSTIQGLPQSAINITIDGINVQDNFSKTSDGFFTYTYPRQDAVEEVTMTSAASGADAAGQGAIQVRFVTRSGANRYQSSLYHYYRTPEFNTNYWFNEKNGLEKNRVILNQFGGRIGGPIVIPGLFDGRGRAFFFFNHEELRLPTEATRTRTALSPLAQQGTFQYNVTVGGQTETRSVNVLQLAASNGQLGSMDPTVSALLAQISGAMATTGAIQPIATDPNTLRYIFQNAASRVEHQPTTRLDFNLSPKHRLSGTYIWVRTFENPNVINSLDPTFPNLPNSRSSLADRPNASTALRSTFGANVVNELRFGGGWGPTVFGREMSPAQFENQGGFSLGFPLGATSATITNSANGREVKHWLLENSVTWLRNNHSLNFGASYTAFNTESYNQNMVPSITFGTDATDPADGLFTAANFSGASAANLTAARALYAFLTGRVTAINGGAQLDEATNTFVYLGKRNQRSRMSEGGIWAQDSWRVKPNVTLNAGVRWEVQLPFTTQNDVFSTAGIADLCGISGVRARNQCNLFQPGTRTGIRPQFVQYDSGAPGYSTDWNNIAPSFGVAWRPNIETGFWRQVLGNPELATVRAGYGVAFNRNGTSDLISFYGSNPGSVITANRSLTLGNLTGPGETLPLLFRNRSRLGPPDFPTTVEYPITATTSNSINVYDPDLQLSYTHSYSFGVQRALTKDMALEVRYVGTRNVNGWSTNDLNEVNIVENGFLDEFKLAQANLQANIAAGRGNTFAYFGPGSGTSPLPIYLAYFNSVPVNQASNATLYTGANWTNTTFVNRLALRNPNVNAAAATDLHGNAGRRAAAISAGLPDNFFVLNPDVSSANFRQGDAATRYNSMQVELRRRLSQGLFMNANYTYGRRYSDTLNSLREGRIMELSTAGVRHALKMSWTYEIPVGHGKRFGASMPGVLNGVIGGWTFDGIARIQSGRILAYSNVRLVGMTEKDLQNAYRIRIDDATRTVYVLPQDIIDESFKAFNISATSPTGYGALGAPSGRYFAPINGPDCIEVVSGDCGPRNIFVTGPAFTRFDFSIKKKFGLPRRANFQLQIDILNVFDAINFIPVAGNPSSATFGQVNSGYTDTTYTYDPGGRLGQISWRISW